MPDPFETLDGEHRIIEKVLTALEATASSDVPVSFYERAIDFIVHFADGCHHAKEEETLFPMLAQRGIPHEMGPIGVMLEEHRAGREYVAAMRELIPGGDLPALGRTARAYAALMRDHIAKEDQVLFPMGRGVLRAEDQAQAAAAFAAVETPSGYVELAEALLREVSATA